MLYFYLFFSSRRRHTRYWRDWSSDVCSSDLPAGGCSVGPLRDISRFAFEALKDRLYGHTAGSAEAQPQIAIAPGAPEGDLGAWVFEVKLHPDRGILEYQGRGLHQNGLPGRQVAHEDIAAGVEQQQPGSPRGCEAVHVAAYGVMGFGVVAVFGREPDARLKPVVGDGGGGGEQHVLADVDGLAGLEGDGDELAGIVLGERDVAGALGLGHDERQARKHSLPSALERHGGDVYLGVSPEQDVVREVDAVTGGQVHVGDRHILALDLAGGIANLQLGHVLARRQLGPAAFRGGGRQLESGAAVGTGGMRKGGAGPAPVAPGPCRDSRRDSRRARG